MSRITDDKEVVDLTEPTLVLTFEDEHQPKSEPKPEPKPEPEVEPEVDTEPLAADGGVVDWFSKPPARPLRPEDMRAWNRSFPEQVPDEVLQRIWDRLREL